MFMHTLAGAAVIGGLGLGVFALSTFTPTQRFGYLMMVLLVAALVGDLIFLPALLAGPVGRFFTGRLKKQARKQAATPDGLGNQHPIPSPHYLPQPSHQPSETATSSEAPRSSFDR